MTITGEASGRLTMEAEGEALTDFPTNRTGFVVLHPSEAAGGRLTIRHSDGQYRRDGISRRRSVPTSRPSTSQPSPTSPRPASPAPSRWKAMPSRWRISATGRMRPSRPISARCPSRGPIRHRQGPKGSPADHCHDQGSGRGQAGKAGRRCQAGPRSADWPDAVDGPVPRSGRAAVRAGPAASLGTAQDVIIRFEADRGHDWRTLSRRPTSASSIGARLAIEAIFNAVDPQAEARHRSSMRSGSADVEPSAVLVSPRREFKTRPSNMLPPGERRDRRTGQRAQSRRALRQASAPARLRSSPNSTAIRQPAMPTSSSSAWQAIVHAADDLSVMETLSVYPAVIASARRLCPGKPIWLGPCTIGMRHNPYGAECGGKSCACPSAGCRRRPPAWRAVRGGFRRRRGGAGCRSRRRPLDPRRADRPLWAGRRRRRAPPAAGGSRRARQAPRAPSATPSRSIGPDWQPSAFRVGACHPNAGCQPDGQPRLR